MTNRYATFRYEIDLSSQSAAYAELGLNRELGLQKLNEVLQECFEVKYDEENGMFSEHLILIAAVSCSNFEFRDILEIGTYDGKTALILSKLFPTAKILTIDLPLLGGEFESTYSRQGKVTEFVKSRDERLAASETIQFTEMNSAALADMELRFDLIWIDGAHGYPVVAMDVINAYRLCRNDGFVLIDDVWTNIEISDKYYRSIGAFESLSELKSASLIDNFYLLPKRMGSRFNIPGRKKFVGFFRRR